MNQKMVTLTIDGRTATVPEGTTVLEAARSLGIDIPTLCYLEEINEIGACRLCVVEVQGQRALSASCVLPAAEGMVVRTNCPEVRESRRKTLELLLSDHPFDCPTCERNLKCELQELAYRFNITGVRYQGERRRLAMDDVSPALVLEPEKCINCGRCVAVCREVQSVGVYDMIDRGFRSVAAPPNNDSLVDTPCVYCGQCVMVCPTAARREKSDVDRVWAALADPQKHVVLQTAPAIRASLGEEFGLEDGSLVTGQMVAAIRRLGFDKVFDTDFAADVVVIEEGTEFLHRLRAGEKGKEKLPLFTSCCPAWVKFCETFYPEFLGNISSTKSPQQTFGALVKTYYAERNGIDPESVFCVSVMPCTAKKFEAARPEMNGSGFRDVDAVLTTRELARMLREAGVDLASLKPEEFDSPMGMSSGAADIFGATGGVMEAALRTVYEKVTGRELGRFEPHKSAHGTWKEAEYDLDGTKVRIAVARTLGEARRLLEAIKAGEVEYHFVEVMACPNGCISGGGQPLRLGRDRIAIQQDRRGVRTAALHREDRQKPIRKSHENPAVAALYEAFLGEPLGPRSRKLLHTNYQAREAYPQEPSHPALGGLRVGQCACCSEGTMEAAR